LGHELPAKINVLRILMMFVKEGMGAGRGKYFLENNLKTFGDFSGNVTSPLHLSTTRPLGALVAPQDSSSGNNVSRTTSSS
jgi:hypothetical protein